MDNDSIVDFKQAQSKKQRVCKSAQRIDELADDVLVLAKQVITSAKARRDAQTLFVLDELLEYIINHNVR